MNQPCNKIIDQVEQQSEKTIEHKHSIYGAKQRPNPKSIKQMSNKSTKQTIDQTTNRSTKNIDHPIIHLSIKQAIAHKSINNQTNNQSIKSQKINRPTYQTIEENNQSTKQPFPSSIEQPMTQHETNI